MNQTETLKFWSKVLIIEDQDSCWLWIGNRRPGNKGGRFRIGKVDRSVNRLVWVVTNGEIPKGLCVLHRCDNPVCVRPSHLFLGTQLDNMRDCAAKGRLYFQKHPEHTQGESHPMVVLTAEKVREIRKRKGEKSTYALAEEYGVCQATIHQIHKGAIWKSLPE